MSERRPTSSARMAVIMPILIILYQEERVQARKETEKIIHAMC